MGDAVEPAAQLAGILQAAERAIGAQERLLHQVARVLDIADEAAQIAEQRRLILPHQHLEGVVVASADARHQARIRIAALDVRHASLAQSR